MRMQIMGWTCDDEDAKYSEYPEGQRPIVWATESLLIGGDGRVVAVKAGNSWLATATIALDSLPVFLIVRVAE